MSVLNISTIRVECKIFLNGQFNVFLRFKCSSCHFELVAMMNLVMVGDYES